MEILEEYDEFFGDSFPTFMFSHLPEEEMLKIASECLEKGKDVYELGYLDEDTDIQY